MSEEICGKIAEGFVERILERFLSEIPNGTL